jgi:glycosyltransferase involved in cell wall biosynthesis
MPSSTKPPIEPRADVQVLSITSLPPPVNGQNVITEAFLSNLGPCYRVSTINISPGEGLDRPLRGHIVRLIRVVRAMAVLLTTRADSVQILYLASESGLGILYTSAICTVARLRGITTYLHHHSYRYIDATSVLMSYLVYSVSSINHIFLSRQMAAAFVARYGNIKNVSISNIAFTQPPTDLGQRSESDNITLGFLSNLSKEKGLFLFLDLLAHLNSTGVNAKGLLAGPIVAFDRDRAEMRLRELGAIVKYLGPIYGAAKADFYSTIDLFVFPTQYRNEAQPTVIFEAMTNGVPSIAFSRGTIASQLGGVGLCIAPQDDFVQTASSWIEASAVQRSVRESARRELWKSAAADHEAERTRAASILDRTGIVAADSPAQPRRRRATQQPPGYQMARSIGGAALSFHFGSPFLHDALAFGLQRQSAVSRLVANRLTLPYRRACSSAGSIFIHIPKNAGTSVNSALYQRSYGHLSAEYLHAIDPNWFDSLDSFAVIREPLKHAISAYLHIRNAGGSDVSLHPVSRWRFRHLTSIDAFLDYLEAHSEDLDRVEYVMRPQNSFVRGKDGTILTRRIFRLEGNNDSLRHYIRGLTGAELSRENQSLGDPITLTNEQKRRLSVIYAADFELYEINVGAHGI